MSPVTTVEEFDLCGRPEDNKGEECKGRDGEIESIMVVLKGMRGKTRDNEVRGHRLSEAEAIR